MRPTWTDLGAACLFAAPFLAALIWLTEPWLLLVGGAVWGLIAALVARKMGGVA